MGKGMVRENSDASQMGRHVMPASWQQAKAHCARWLSRPHIGLAGSVQPMFTLRLLCSVHSWLDTGSGDLASITRFGASNNCTMPCLGNPTQRCGGDFTADMYTVTDQLPASIPERNTTFLGCFR